MFSYRFSPLPVAAAALLAITPLASSSTTPSFAAESPAASQSAPANQSAEEKALDQKISAEEPVATGQTEISAGHVDIGPKYVDGKWTLMVHDDHEAQAVWRKPADVVMSGNDTALLPVPDDPRYSFVQAKPGENVYVIPQTELSGVVWPGWNTQDPEVISKLGAGVTLTLEKIEGPGDFSLYLENGNFSQPQVLWTSDQKEAQDIWVEPNTHTHANWVFTKPGAYYLTVTAKAELADGTVEKDTQTLQFAVGSDTSAQQVFDGASTHASEDAGASAADANGDSDASAGAPADTPAEDASAPASFTPGLIIAGAAVLLLAIAGGVLLAVRKNKRAQQRAKDLLK